MCFCLYFRQRSAGRKRSKRHQKKTYSLRLEKQLHKEHKEKEKFKKRYQRLLKKHLSPRSKINHEFHHCPKWSENVSFSTLPLLKTSVKWPQSQSQWWKRETINCKNMCRGKDGAGVQAQKICRNTFGLLKKKVETLWQRPTHIQMKKNTRTADVLKNCVKVFFEWDDVSRLTTGRKQTKTKYRLKKQKLFLMDTMKNAHRKFLSKYPDRRISYSLVCHLCPFWVVTPILSERETCLCKIHENFGFTTNKLYHLKLLTHCNTEKLIEKVVCGPHKKDCMYCQCDECKLNNFPIITPFEPTTLVSYTQWVMEEKHCSETVI